MKNIIVLKDRMKQILANDKKENPNKISGLIKSEIFYVLKNYMDINIDDLKFDIGIDNYGKYIINFSVETARLYITNYLI